MAGPTEPSNQSEWPKLLSHSVHELRSPLTPLMGYLRMLEKTGPLTELQRGFLKECLNVCAKMAGVLEEASNVAHFEEIKFKRSAVDLSRLLADVLATLPDLPDRAVTVELEADNVGKIEGDAKLLKEAFVAIVIALRRELVSSNLMNVRVERLTGHGHGTPVIRITVGEAIRMPRLLTLSREELGTFDWKRGGSGLSLAIARRVIEAHGGTLLAPLEGSKTCAVISIPSI
jgi:signal transduction histidine kinase